MARLLTPKPTAAALCDLLADTLPASVARTARQLGEAQKRLDASLPPTLRGQVGVARLGQDLLVLACDNGAVASHLRHRLDALRIALRERGLDINQIDIKVAPERLPTTRPPEAKSGLSKGTLAAISNLHDRIEPGPLREALDRMLHNHRRD